ncbi:MAG: tetratricopeptide repeat protein [Acidobacteriota bacterium]|nr:tetratricopeptide repeat protein [Acidobacteriota bacterium]
MKHRVLSCAVLFPFLFVLAAAPRPVSAAGTIKGKVVDVDGNPIPGVKIALHDETRGQKYDTKTDKKGNFFLMGIPPAVYRLKLEKEGFRTLEGTITINPDGESVFDAVLAPESPHAVKPEWEEKNARANDLFERGRYDEAAGLYREILAVNPDLAAIHFNLGDCAYNLRRYDEAVSSFREAIRLKPDFFEAYANLANACGRLKKFEEAILVFDKAIQAFPENAGLFYSLGLLHLNLGHGAKAAEYLEISAAIDPKNPSPFYSLGIAYTQTGDLGKAIKNYERYTALSTDAAEIERARKIIEELRPLKK